MLKVSAIGRNSSSICASTIPQQVFYRGWVSLTKANSRTAAYLMRASGRAATVDCLGTAPGAAGRDVERRCPRRVLLSALGAARAGCCCLRWALLPALGALSVPGAVACARSCSPRWALPPAPGARKGMETLWWLRRSRLCRIAAWHRAGMRALHGFARIRWGHSCSR